MIAGAPKCGTTALYRALQQHPRIFLPSLKEPQYFAFDHARGRAVERVEFYDDLYDNASENQLRGDASAMYLSSTDAIPAILSRRPDAKFLALIRDPVEMFVSWHNECLKSLDEDQADPERAWRLQGERAVGKLPKLCKEPGYLQYRAICSLGSQIQRLFELVPEPQRMVIGLDSLIRSPSTVYKQIIDFLGIEDSWPAEFPRENAYASHRSQFIARLVRLVHVSSFFKAQRLRWKPFLNRHGIYPLTWAVNYSLKKVDKAALSASFEHELREAFRADIILLGSVIGQDLRQWLNVEPDSADNGRRVSA